MSFLADLKKLPTSYGDSAHPWLMFLLWLSCSSWGNGGRTGGSCSTSCRDHRNVMNTVELLWKSQFICARHSHIKKCCSVQILLFCFYSLTTSLTRWILSITKIKCCKAKKHNVASKPAKWLEWTTIPCLFISRAQMSGATDKWTMDKCHTTGRHSVGEPGDPGCGAVDWNTEGETEKVTVLTLVIVRLLSGSMCSIKVTPGNCCIHWWPQVAARSNYYYN